jgi:Ca2+-binding RTX toxin-like protein
MGMGRWLGSLGMTALVACTLACFGPVAGAMGAESAAEGPPEPTCAEGPVREGAEIVGTPCADHIVVPPSVTYVNGGAGNDVIAAAPLSGGQAGPVANAVPCTTAPHCGVGSQEFNGGPGNDTVFGERGNDILRGGEGNDRLYGGIGDDLLEGGPGNDLLAGGFGADTIDGGEGSDFVRGDATEDHILDTGTNPADVDTLSYATGATPGFGNTPPFGGSPYPNFELHSGFPKSPNGRGVYLDLTSAAKGNGFNGGAPNGGGADTVAGNEFERIIGSPFSDYIVGSKPGQQIFGGGGGDVLISGGSGTSLVGGADGDDCVGEATTSGCESVAAQGPVSRTEAEKTEVGAMVEGASDFAELYLVGASTGGQIEDRITVTRSGAAPTETITFHRTGGAEFATPQSASGCKVQGGGAEVACALGAPLDSVTIAGLAGNDTLAATELPETTSLMLLGGEGNDEISGGDLSDDTLVDGPGNDILHGHGGDDGLVNNGGHDILYGEGGNDLFLSTVVCEGDVIEGGEGRDNASWAKFSEVPGEPGGVDARLDEGLAGRVGAENHVSCPTGTPDHLNSIEDLEGSFLSDVLYGDSGPNQLLGHTGEDTYYAGPGDDTILANAGTRDAVINCGAGENDSALIDLPAVGDPAPIECERVNNAAPENYEMPPELMPTPVGPAPTPVTPTPPPVRPLPRRDTTPPRTAIAKRPAKLVRARVLPVRVSFRFSAGERATFRCKLDRGPYKACRSPHSFKVAAGAHVFRVYAIDAAGNRDRTAATFAFRVKRLPAHPRKRAPRLP